MEWIRKWHQKLLQKLFTKPYKNLKPYKMHPLLYSKTASDCSQFYWKTLKNSLKQCQTCRFNAHPTARLWQRVKKINKSLSIMLFALGQRLAVASVLLSLSAYLQEQPRVAQSCCYRNYISYAAHFLAVFCYFISFGRLKTITPQITQTSTLHAPLRVQ